METRILHYVHDPMCGWCYGAAPLLAAARDILPVRAHGGGMMAGPQRRPVTSSLRDYVLSHDQRIARLTGQPFGDAYADGLLRDTSAVLDSEPPIAAVLAADELGSRGLDMLARLQTAHYVEGRRVADRAVLVALAAELGLEGRAFEQALGRVEGAVTQRHIAESRALLARLGGRGFPTFAMEREGRFELIDISLYFGRTRLWQDWLQSQVSVSVPASPDRAAEPGCSPEGCALQAGPPT